MMKQFYFEFWNTNGQKIGMQVSAYTALDAKIYAEKMPEFKTLAKYPQAV